MIVRGETRGAVLEVTLDRRDDPEGLGGADASAAMRRRRAWTAYLAEAASLARAAPHGERVRSSST